MYEKWKEKTCWEEYSQGRFEYRPIPSQEGFLNEKRWEVVLDGTAIGVIETATGVWSKDVTYDGYTRPGHVVASRFDSMDMTAMTIAYESNVLVDPDTGLYAIETSDDPWPLGPALFTHREACSASIAAFPHRLAPQGNLSSKQIATVRLWCSEQFGQDEARWLSLGSVFCFRDDADATAFHLYWHGREIEEGEQ